MPIIVLIAICLGMQLTAYICLDRKKLPGWKYVFLILLLFLNCFIFPRFYYPGIPQEGRMACDLVIVPVYVFFILFGAGGAVLLHLVYWLIRKLVRKV